MFLFIVVVFAAVVLLYLPSLIVIVVGGGLEILQWRVNDHLEVYFVFVLSHYPLVLSMLLSWFSPCFVELTFFNLISMCVFFLDVYDR